MAGLRFLEVGKIYDNGVEAVRGFSLEIASGEFVVIIGPSGSGKSTVLRMIAGLEDISSGQIVMDGVLLNSLPAGKRGVAMVSQSFALLPHQNVSKNMSLGLRAQKLGRDEIKARVADAAQFLGLTDYLKRKPNTLSGGQRQRVALGRAMVTHPVVFVLDEPLSNLDAKLRTEMRAQIIKIFHRVKSTFIYVTHDQIEAMTMATRIVVMDNGQIMDVGTPQQIYTTPACKFVAGFIGSPPMNFLGVTLSKEAEREQVRSDMSGKENIGDKTRSDSSKENTGDKTCSDSSKENAGDKTCSDSSKENAGDKTCSDSNSTYKMGDRIVLKFVSDNAGEGQEFNLDFKDFCQIPEEYFLGQAKITMGIRPEDIIYNKAEHREGNDPRDLGQATNPTTSEGFVKQATENNTTKGENQIRIRVTVRFVEDLGGEMLVYCTFCNEELVLKTKCDYSIAVGKTLSLSLPSKGLHFFDGTTGQSLKPIIR